MREYIIVYWAFKSSWHRFRLDREYLSFEFDKVGCGGLSWGLSSNRYVQMYSVCEWDCLLVSLYCESLLEFICITVFRSKELIVQNRRQKLFCVACKTNIKSQSTKTSDTKVCVGWLVKDLRYQRKYLRVSVGSAVELVGKLCLHCKTMEIVWEL